MYKGVRWIVDITYHSEAGDVDVRHHLMELKDLHNVVEAGPDWHCLKGIAVSLARPPGQGIKTLEAADE
ncbi:hypothetical protein [Hyphomicrobium sp.]|uniref:hypothetical protein n=1 Tax=Hyphomicrobium sp. TaxID=82 RepID=UPI003F72E654